MGRNRQGLAYDPPRDAEQEAEWDRLIAERAAEERAKNPRHGGRVGDKLGRIAEQPVRTRLARRLSTVGVVLLLLGCEPSSAALKSEIASQRHEIAALEDEAAVLRVDQANKIIEINRLNDCLDERDREIETLRSAD